MLFAHGFDGSRPRGGRGIGASDFGSFSRQLPVQRRTGKGGLVERKWSHIQKDIMAYGIIMANIRSCLTISRQYARFSLYWPKKTWQDCSTPLNVISYNLCWDILSESQAAMVSPKHCHLSWAWEWKGAWLDGNDILFQRTEPLLFNPTLLRFSTEEEWCSGIWDLQPQLGWNPSCHQDQKLLIPKVWIFSFSCFQVRIVLIG